jgi:flagellar protein FliO/FliZ
LFALALRVGFSLLVILGLMWLLARAVRRPLGSGRHIGPLSVLSRQQLSRGSAVTVVRVADRAMVLGVTDAQVSLLGEVDLEEFDQHHHEHRDHLPVADGQLPAAHPEPARGRLDGSLLSPRTWTSTIDFLRDRTSRR